MRTRPTHPSGPRDLCRGVTLQPCSGALAVMAAERAMHDRGGRAPVVVGLTGSIGTGKSTVAGMIRGRGVPVHDADATVHALYSPGGEAVRVVAELFPGTLDQKGGVDRGKLAACVLGPGNEENMLRLEGAVHPLVQRKKVDFLVKCAEREERVVVLDVPLLFEKGLDTEVDFVIAVSCSEATQRKRVLARPGMTEDKLNNIMRRQLPTEEKRRRAKYVIDTEQTLEETESEVGRILRAVRGMEGSAFWRIVHSQNPPRSTGG